MKQFFYGEENAHLGDPDSNCEYCGRESVGWLIIEEDEKILEKDIMCPDCYSAWRKCIEKCGEFAEWITYIRSWRDRLPKE